MRIRGLTVLGPLASLCLASPAVIAQHEDHAMPVAPSSLESAGLYNEQDLLFMLHMIVHHEQALVMADLVPERTERAEFIRFARYVKRAQAAEIGLMQSLVELAESRGISIPEHELHGDPPMAGMLSSAQMAALAAAGGPEFDRLWMEGMIYHHQGAIDMARLQQDQQLANERRPYGLDVLVEDIVEEQRAEIAKMRDWLAEWGLTDAARATH